MNLNRNIRQRNETANLQRPRPFIPIRGTRVGGLLGAAAITAVIVGSQLGIAQNYNDKADAQVATTRSQSVAQRAALPASAAQRT